MSGVLEPCPFCGSEDSFVERADFSSCYVMCNQCGARGPSSCDETTEDADATEACEAEPGELAARRLWNKRDQSEHTADQIIADIIRDIAELPDRTSPDDWPEAMVVTADELTVILQRYFESARLAGIAEEWQPIETCNAWRFDHMRPMLAFWTARGVCETYWDEDDDFDDRPKGWVSPREGWRSPGDQCIPVNQDAVTHWRPLPAPPQAIAGRCGGGEGRDDG